VLQGVAVCCRVVQGVAGCCGVLQCVAVSCRVVQCVAGCHAPGSNSKQSMTKILEPIRLFVAVRHLYTKCVCVCVLCVCVCVSVCV